MEVIITHYQFIFIYPSSSTSRHDYFTAFWIQCLLGIIQESKTNAGARSAVQKTFWEREIDRKNDDLVKDYQLSIVFP
jgi:hypothetical protein